MYYVHIIILYFVYIYIYIVHFVAVGDPPRAHEVGDLVGRSKQSFQQPTSHNLTENKQTTN